MALSNWDTMAFGTDGKPNNGTLMGFQEGTSVSFYKNWLYVHDAKAWHEECGYVKDTVAEISHGDICLSGFHIIAERGPQNGIFAVIVSTKYTGEGKGIKRERRIMAGIGCSGYDDNLPRLAKAMKVDLSKYPVVMQGSLHESSGETFYTLDCWKKKDPKSRNDMVEFRIPQKGNKRLDSRWVGVTSATFKEFRRWLIKVNKEWSLDLDGWIKKVQLKDALRFNQGDAFFADHMGMALSATKVGKPAKPVLESVLGPAIENIVKED